MTSAMKRGYCCGPSERSPQRHGNSGQRYPEFASVREDSKADPLMHRKDDTDQRTRFRSARMFQSQGQWYCNTREGRVLGPFLGREAIFPALRQYLLEQGIRLADDIWDVPGASR